MTQEPELPPMNPLPSLAPSGSTNASLLGAALSTIVIYILSLKGINLPAGIESAVAGLVTVLAGYLPASGRRG